jgi:23S rRNA (cytosine1962-C5)-methyltransferase
VKAVTVKLKPGREAPVLHGHPWIFSGAIAEVQGETCDPMGVAEILAHDGTWLARGLWDGRSGLAVRIYTRVHDQPLNREWLAETLRAAVRRRALLPSLAGAQTDAYRLVFSESDGLSGLIVDRYGEHLCIQIGARVLLPWLDDMCAILKEATGLTKYWLQAEPDAAAREKLELPPSELREAIPFRENGLRFEVSPMAKQKTGFFLDQRENRRRVAAYCAGRRVLSAFCFSGAFEVYAAAAGAAQVIGLDRSEPAVQQARRHHELNGTAANVEYRVEDVGTALRKFRDEGRTFDVVILDPPRFVAGHAQKEKGLRAYKDINLLAMKLLAREGILATFSCSGQVSMDEFKMMIGWAAADAGKNVQIIEQLSQPPDHPILVGVPESEYLKGLICRVE